MTYLLLSLLGLGAGFAGLLSKIAVCVVGAAATIVFGSWFVRARRVGLVLAPLCFATFAAIVLMACLAFVFPELRPWEIPD